MKVKEVIAALENAIPLPFPQTCDIYHIGNPEAEVQKIASVFMADVEVIRKAAAEGVNLIITHEPTWHNGLSLPLWDEGQGWTVAGPEFDWLRRDPVALEKKKLIEENGITIYRSHDRMHFHKPDLIYQGWIQEMGWESYLRQDETMWHYDIPATTLGGLAGFFKEKLGMDAVQVIGDPGQKAEHLSVLVGGGSLGLGDELMPMRDMMEKGIDTLVCGETTEWTSISYVRDAAQLGLGKGMIILGHNRTEEAGMKHFPAFLQPLVGDIPVVFIPSGEPVCYL